MDHRQYIEQYLSADVDGALNPAERQAVAAHLAVCADCRQRQADERALKAMVRQGLPILPAPPELRRNIIHALDREDARRLTARRRTLWIGSFAALATAAVLLLLIVAGGPGRQSPANRALQSAVADYLQAERGFTASPAISSQADLALALTNEFGYPFIWDFSPLGLTLAGARIDHRPDGGTVAYSLYKGKAGSILCINLRQVDFAIPPGGQVVHGIHFYRSGDVWVGVVNYGSVFCYFVTRLTPAQMMPALVRNAPNAGA
jgi:hypothetical protein